MDLLAIVYLLLGQNLIWAILRKSKKLLVESSSKSSQPKVGTKHFSEDFVDDKSFCLVKVLSCINLIYGSECEIVIGLELFRQCGHCGRRATLTPNWE